MSELITYFYYHEGHEVNEGKKQSDLLNKVIDSVFVISKALLIKIKRKRQSHIQVLHALHGKHNDIV